MTDRHLPLKTEAQQSRWPIFQHLPTLDRAPKAHKYLVACIDRGAFRHAPNRAWLTDKVPRDRIECASTAFALAW